MPTHTTPVIGLHMIVRDEEATITPCLDSVLPHVQHAVILDTGSTDATRQLVTEALERHGHTTGLYEAEWPGDFAQARNHALALLREHHPDCTHILWLDGDDILAGGQHLPHWAGVIDGRTGPDGSRLGAGVVHYAYAHDLNGLLACSHYRERLVLAEALDAWVQPIHEVQQLHAGWSMQQVPAPTGATLTGIPNMAWPVAPDGVEVIHNRPASKMAVTEGRNLALLEREREDGTATPRTLFYLGQEYAIAAAVAREKGDQDGWRGHLGRAVEILGEYDAVAEWDEERYQAAHRRADFLRDLGDHQTAVMVDQAATVLLPGWPDAWHGLAESHLALGNVELARMHSDTGLARPYPTTMLILNPTDYTVAAWGLRARIEEAAGQHEAALSALGRALGHAPQDMALNCEAGRVQELVNRGKTRDALLALDECLARHDENLKAADLLTRCVPYFLEWDPEVTARRNRRRAGVRHVAEGDRYSEFYGDDNPHIPITTAVGIPDPWQAITRLCEGDAETGAPGLPRAQFILQGLREQAEERGAALADLTLLDVGCNDGWLGLWLVKAHGLGRYVGHDLNAESLAGAESMREQIGVDPARAEFRHGEAKWDPSVEGGWPDAVVSFEVIEHVPDAGAWLDYLADLCGGEAVVYVSTPNGAFERGNIQDWDVPTARGHVRALTAGDMGTLVLDRGALTGLEETRDGLVVLGFEPMERDYRVDLYLGGAGGQWSPLDALNSYLGGSETMACRLATQLANRGARVRVWCGVPWRMAIQQVEYLPFYGYDVTQPTDVLIGSRCPGLIAQHPNARTRILWLHDAEYPDLQEHQMAWDAIWCVSAWQGQHLGVDQHPGFAVLPNGIPLDRWGQPLGFDDREPWVVYSSSPDRGLLNLLRIWPLVMEAVPDAQLHVAYGFNQTWRAMEKAHPGLREVREAVEGSMSMPGFVWHGQMGQLALADLQRKARVWAYPTDFPEVSCITAMEAQAAGLGIVTTHTAALDETVGDAAAAWFQGPVAGWDDRTDALFADAVQRLLVMPQVWGDASQRALVGARRWSVDRVGDIAEGLIAELAARSWRKAAA